MPEQKVPALAGLLRSAGYSWAAADEICAAVDRLPRPGCSSDDVAAALFKWRRDFTRQQMGSARKRAAEVLGGSSEHSTYSVDKLVPEDDAEIEGQLALFDDAQGNRQFEVQWAWVNRKPG